MKREELQKLLRQAIQLADEEITSKEGYNWGTHGSAKDLRIAAMYTLAAAILPLLKPEP